MASFVQVAILRFDFLDDQDDLQTENLTIIYKLAEEIKVRKSVKLNPSPPRCAGPTDLSTVSPLSLV